MTTPPRQCSSPPRKMASSSKCSFSVRRPSCLLCIPFLIQAKLDVFSLAKKLVALEVVRDDEFLPLKNKDGTANSNPTTCRQGVSGTPSLSLSSPLLILALALHQKYLRNAGATLTGQGLCEISPLVSFAGEGLDKVAGRTLELPLHLTKESWSKL